MRIALFLSSLRGGGAERVTAHLANAWVAMGREVTILTLTSAGSDEYPLHPSVHRIGLEADSPSSDLSTAMRSNARRIALLRAALRSIRPNVLITMMANPSILGLLASAGLGIRTVVSERVHPPMWPIGRTWSLLRRLSYPFADVTVAQTEETRKWLRRIGCPTPLVIPNPVAWPIPDGEPRIAPEKTVSPRQRVLLAVGRLECQKGFDLLIEAFGELAISHPEWNLVILGEGRERAKLERQVARAQLSARVALPGRAGNVQEWYGRADAFVLSSRFEGFPNSLLEAMACGCAVVSFDCLTGPRDLITHGETGLLVELGSGAPGLASALEMVFRDEGLRATLSRQAQHVRDQYSVPNVVSFWERALPGDSI